MTNTARKIERRPEHIRQRDTLHAWELTPQSLREILLFQKDRLSTDIMQVVPLTRAFRSVTGISPREYRENSHHSAAVS
mgnify:CR=1 FL=1